MKYDILIDIDGVVRDFTPILIKKLRKKIYSYEEGSVIFDIVKDDPNFLINAPETKYLKVIKEYIKNPIFVSCQKESWRNLTRKWIDQHFDNATIIFVNSIKNKNKYYNKAKLVIEDYPYFNNYDKIILINACYNQNVKNPLKRIKTIIQLENILKKDKNRAVYQTKR